MSRKITQSDKFFNCDKEIILSLNDLQMQYSGKCPTLALTDFTLDIHKGEFICILGPSGCGKSTLLSIIAGYVKASSGSAKMNGQEINGMDWHRSIIFQTATLYPWLNVYNNIAFGLKVRGIPKQEIDVLVKEYIELVGLSEFINAKPYELSGGMKQRVALARALVNNPAIILMDEPLGALDAFTRKNMQSQIRDIWRKTGMTALLITHDVDEALALGSRIIVMTPSPGRIAGVFDTMFSHPLTGTAADDEVYSSQEYMSVRRSILDLIS